MTSPVVQAPEPLPEIMSHAEWKKASYKGALSRRSDKLRVVDNALEAYHKAVEKAPLTERNMGNRELRRKLDDVRVGLDIWCMWKDTQHGSWEKSGRAEAALALRRQVYSSWVPVSFNAEEREALEYWEKQRQVFVRALLSGRRLENKVYIQLRKAKKAAQQGKAKEAVKSTVGAGKEAHRQAKPFVKAASAAKPVAKEVKTAVEQLLELVAKAIKDLGEALSAIVDKVGEAVAALCRSFMAQLEKLKQALENLLALWSSKLRALLDAILKPISDLIHEIQQVISWAVDMILEALGNVADLVLKKLEEAAQRVEEAVEAVVDRVVETVEQAVQKLKSALQAICDAFAELLEPLFEIARAIQAAVQAVQDAILAEVQKIKDAVAAARHWIASKAQALYDAVARALGELGELYDNLATMMRELVDGAVDFIEELLKQLGRPLEWLRARLGSLVSVLMKMFGALKLGAMELFNSVCGWLKDIIALMATNISAAFAWFRNLLGAIFGFSLPNFLADMVPFLGTVNSIRKGVQAWYKVYKRVKQERRTKDTFAFSQSPTVASALEGLKTAIQRRLADEVVAATTATASCVGEIVADASLVGSAVSVAARIAKTIAAAATAAYRYVQAYRESKGVNALMEEVDEVWKEEAATDTSSTSARGEQQLDMTRYALTVDRVFKKSPLVCCYMLLCANTSDIVRLSLLSVWSQNAEGRIDLKGAREQRAKQADVHFGEAGWMDRVEVLKSKYIDPLLDAAAEMIRLNPYAFDGLQEYAAKESALTKARREVKAALQTQNAFQEQVTPETMATAEQGQAAPLGIAGQPQAA